MLLRLLLVDDEPRQLRAMMSIIQGLRPEYEVHTATDGQEALELLGEEAFDVVITDIRMPVMDGLQLLERLVQRGGGEKVILLSGHGEFTYAQQAIRMGIFDYLVKPVGRAEIEHLLQKIDTALMKEKQEHWNVTELARRLDNSLPAYREHLLRRWLHGHSRGEELQAQGAEAFKNCSGFVYRMKLGRGKGAEGERRESLLTRLNQELAERLRAAAGALSLTMEEQPDQRVTLILHEKDAFQGVKPIASLVEREVLQLAASHSVNVMIGIGLPLDECIWSSGPQCCEHAALALEQGFFLGTNQVIVWEKPMVNLPGSIDLFEQEPKFAAAVSGCDEEEMNEFLNRMLEQVRQSRQLSPARIKADTARLLLNRLREARHLTSELEYGDLAVQIQDRVMACEDYRELRHWAKKLTVQIIGLYRQSVQDKNSLVIQKCKEYIRERCGEELTLELLAHRFHFNPSYFSTLFKTSTGMNLSDYLTKVRMDQAQMMLMQTDEKIADIARKVGYKEAGYFIRIFKREMGTSPRRYRSLIGKESP